LTDDVQSLAVARLRDCLTRQLDRDQFGAVDPLTELATHARQCRREVSADKKLLAFVLEAILRQWADDMSDQPVPESRYNFLRSRFLAPVQETVECLSGREIDPAAIATRLVAAIPDED